MNPVSPTHDEDPGGGDAAAVETISEKLSLKVAADLGDPRCSAETSNDQQENSAIESQRQIDFLQEHTEAMGNSFHALTKQLSFREQQLVGISTNNAELQAENDELRGKVTYLEEYSSDVENFSRKIEVHYLLNKYASIFPSFLKMKSTSVSCSSRQPRIKLRPPSRKIMSMIL